MKEVKKGDIVFSDEDGWYGLLIEDGVLTLVNGVKPSSQLVCTVLVLRRDYFPSQVGTIAKWKLSFPVSILRKGCTPTESC
jgi:hypothetical protein